MRIVKTLLGQTLIDIAIQELGDAGRVMEIAKANSLAISDELEAGTLLFVGDADKSKRDLVKLFAQPENTPASDDLGEEITSGAGGGLPVVYEPVREARLVQVLTAQTLIDIAIQVLGDAERAMELAVLNGKSLSEYLTPGEYIKFPEADIDKTNLVQMYKDKALAPASGEYDVDVLSPLEGIGYWYLENDFVVQ